MTTSIKTDTDGSGLILHDGNPILRFGVGGVNVNAPMTCQNASPAMNSVINRQDLLQQLSGPTVINMPSSQTVVPLTRYDEVHVYSGLGETVDLGTGLVNGGVYQVTAVWRSNGSPTNNDTVLRPNFFDYSNQFHVSQVNMGPSGPIAVRAQGTLAHFAFDHFAGTEGADGFFNMTIWNETDLMKAIQYSGGDTFGGTVTATGIWNNTSTAWIALGRLTFKPSASPALRYKVRVRRIM